MGRVRSGKHNLKAVVPATGQSNQGLRRRGQGRVVGDDMPDDVLTIGGQKRQCLGAEAIAVPQMAGSARHPSDLSAAHAQSVVVKFLPESDFLASPRVERQIDDRALGAHYAEGESQSAWLTATLEYDIGSAVPGPVTPSAFQHDGRVDILRIDNLKSEVGRDVAT